MKTKKQLFVLMIISISYFSSFAQIGKCKGKYLGNIIAYNTPSNYTSLWNQATSENGSKWGSVEGTKGTYNFTNSDLAYNWAKINGGLFKYHCLVWGSQTPSWVETASTSTIQTAIEDYIKAVANHYSTMGGINMIDVLNEPVNTAMPGNMKAALTAGYQADPANANDKNNQYGWVIWSFQLARKYFPNTILLINEYNTEMNWNSCRTPYLAMANAVKNAPNLTDGSKNLIDGIGLQCHGIDNLTTANFKSYLDEIWTKTGLPAHITEFDQVANPNEAKQQTVFSSLIPIAWEHPHVAGITLWGYIQGSTWINGNGVTGSGGTDSGIQYASGTDRPALTWLKSYMVSQTSLSCCPAPWPFASCTSSGAPTVSINAPANNTAYTLGSTIIVSATATDANGTVSKVEFYQGTTLIGTDNTSPYSITWTPTIKGSYSITAKATDNESNATTSSAVAISVKALQSPYLGTAWSIPGTIQFENYDEGGQDSAYYDSSPGSDVTPVVNYRTDEDVDIENCTDAGTGYNIGYATAGEWLEYTVNVTATGTYDMDLRVACNGDGRTISVKLGSVTIANNLSMPNTAGWQTWQTVKVAGVALTAGQQIMRVTIGTTDYVNLNYVTFTALNTNTPPTVSITSPVNNAIFTSGSVVSLTATASDADGTISKVEFYNGTTLLNSDATSPYSYSWTNVAEGTYSITAKAYDDKSLTTTSTPIAITVEALVENLITNSEFDNGTAGWDMQYNSSTAGTFTVVTNTTLSGTNAAEVCPTTAGTADWNVQLRQNAPITSGKTYEISFMAKAAAARTMAVAIQPDVDPYPIYFSQQVILTSTAQTFTYTFSPTTTDAVAKLKFFLGNNTRCVNIDKVSMTEVVLTDVTNEINFQEFKVYPNPAKQNVIVSFDITDKVNSIEILNTIGQTIYAKQIKTTNKSERLDISGLQNGVYFIKVKTDNGNVIKKIVKE